MMFIEAQLQMHKGEVKVLHIRLWQLQFIYRETVMRSWKTNEKNKATYKMLLRVCLKSGQESCADAIVKLMKEIEKKKQIERGKYKIIITTA